MTSTIAERLLTRAKFNESMIRLDKVAYYQKTDAAIDEEAATELTTLLQQVTDLRAGIKRLSDEEELLAETTDGDMFSLVSLAAKLATAEQREKELVRMVQAADDSRVEQIYRATEAEAALSTLQDRVKELETIRDSHSRDTLAALLERDTLLQRCEKADREIDKLRIELTSAGMAECDEVRNIDQKNWQTTFSELTERCEKAEAALERVRKVRDETYAYMVEYKDRAELAERQRDQAMKALEPFAKLADIYDGARSHYPDNEPTLERLITVGDLRAARNAMGEPKT